jgi:multidrug efflux pump subunit AcrB
MANLSELTLSKSTIAWVLLVVLLVGGVIAYDRLGRFEDPEFVIRQAVVVVPYPGALPGEVAEEVADVVERYVQQLQEVKEVTSVSTFGSVRVSVEIDMRFAKTRDELEQIWDKLRRKVQDAQRELPPGAGPAVVDDDFGEVYALFWAVTGDGYTLEQIDEYVRDLRRELRLVPGVARVATLGGRREAIFVEISSVRAAQLGIPLARIDAALRERNLISASGDVVVGDQRVEIAPVSTLDSVEDVASIVLGDGGETEGGLVELGDVADVYRGTVDPPSALVRHDGEPAIGLGVANAAGGNVVAMGEAVVARLAELENQRPVGMELHPVSLQSESVRESVTGFLSNLVAAIVIVVLVLIVSMGWRSGLIVGAILVVTVAGTLVAMLLDGIAMHRISLGALIIALGMLVDNAIVVTDGILVRLQRGQEARRAAVEVVEQTKWPLLGGTAVGILAFSAIGLSSSEMGEYAGSLFWVILYSMLFSWLFAVTFTPLFCVRFLRAPELSPDAAPSGAMRRYRTVLRAVLRRRGATLVTLVVLLAASVVGFGFVPPGFMPESARPQFVIDMYLPQGTTIETTSEKLSAFEDIVLAKEGVTNVSSFVGRGALRFMLTYAPEDPNTAYGQLLVDVDDASRIENLVVTLQDELSAVHADASVKAWKFMLGRGGGKKIEAAFRGPDPAVLRRLAEEAKAIMAAEPDAMAVQDDWRERVPVLRPVVDPIAAERAGVNATHVSAALERHFSGARVGVYREGDRLLPIISRSSESERTDAAEIDNVPVFSPAAARFLPAGQLVTEVALEFSDAILRRVDGFPMIRAQCDPLPGALSGPLLEKLRPEIEAIELPPGYELIWKGEYEASQEANAALAASAPFGFAAMVLAVVFMFNAIRPTLVIWLTAPLALIGVTIGLLLVRAPFEFMAILGFLSLIGMLVKNSIVLVDQIALEIREGKDGASAVLDASASRARPVVLGALTTVLGVAPLLLDPFFQSMAVTIMFGLIFATVLTLVVVPVLYALFFRVPQPISE